MNTTHIENLVFESGGVKGVAYIGAIRALEEQNALQGIEKVAGTSSADAEKNALIAEGYQATTVFFEERIIA